MGVYRWEYIDGRWAESPLNSNCIGMHTMFTDKNEHVATF